MIKVNIHNAKTHLSEYLTRLMEEEVIVICKRNIPIAEIRPIPAQPASLRPLGLAKGVFHVSPAFFEPLPEEIIDSFTGK